MIQIVRIAQSHPLRLKREPLAIVITRRPGSLNVVLVWARVRTARVGGSIRRRTETLKKSIRCTVLLHDDDDVLEPTGFEHVRDTTEKQARTVTIAARYFIHFSFNGLSMLSGVEVGIFSPMSMRGGRRILATVLCTRGYQKTT